MARLMILTPLLILVLNTVSTADDDQPSHELLYPVEARILDYISRSGDAFVVSTRIATTDDFDAVVEFYEDKLGRELDPRGNRIRHGGSEPLISVVANDSFGITPGGPALNFDRDKPRGIDLVTFVKITPEEQITLVVSRLKDEEYTHIVLTHAKDPR